MGIHRFVKSRSEHDSAIGLRRDSIFIGSARVAYDPPSFGRSSNARGSMASERIDVGVPVAGRLMRRRDRPEP